MNKLPPEVLRAHKGVSFTGISTTFVCYKVDGEFVLSKRGQKSRDEKGVWDSGAGGLKWGITLEDNVSREVMEEYGAKARKIDFLGYSDVFRTMPDGTPTHWLALRFAVLVDKKEVRINEPEVIDEIGWFTLKTMPSPVHSQLKAQLDMASYGPKPYIK